MFRRWAVILAILALVAAILSFGPGIAVRYAHIARGLLLVFGALFVAALILGRRWPGG